jgi:hypothetical protein
MPRSVGSPLQHTTINRFRLGTGWLDLKKSDSLFDPSPKHDQNDGCLHA